MKTVPDYPDYYVTPNGEVWSNRCREGHKKHKLRKLNPYLNPNGYRQVTLYNSNGCKSFKVAVLILTTFVSPRPDGMESCHNDGNPLNDSKDNLRWDTHANNLRDKLLHETHRAGERHGMAKLTLVQIKQIRLWHSFGALTQRDLAERFGVSEAHVSVICRKRLWRNV